ncbi:hypothetical protein LGQ04_05715 [Cellulosimicrobium marinum]|nr:hypothetical protein [Cellulosimicrobium marinum]
MLVGLSAAAALSACATGTDTAGAADGASSAVAEDPTTAEATDPVPLTYEEILDKAEVRLRDVFLAEVVEECLARAGDTGPVEVSGAEVPCPTTGSVPAVGAPVETTWGEHRWDVELDDEMSTFTVTFTPTEGSPLLVIEINGDVESVTGATLTGSLDPMVRFNPFTVETLVWS